MNKLEKAAEEYRALESDPEFQRPHRCIIHGEMVPWDQVDYWWIAAHGSAVCLKCSLGLKRLPPSVVGSSLDFGLKGEWMQPRGAKR